MLQLALSPKHGWEDIAYDNPPLRPLIVSGFVPWLVVASVSALVPFFRTGDFNGFAMVVATLVMFLKYFVTYFFASFIFQFFMPALTKGVHHEQNSNILLINAIGLLAFISIIKNCVPVDMPVVNFFPLYVLLIMWRGNRYVKVPKTNGFKFAALCFAVTLLPPMLLQMLFNLLLR